MSRRSQQVKGVDTQLDTFHDSADMKVKGGEADSNKSQDCVKSGDGC